VLDSPLVPVPTYLLTSAPLDSAASAATAVDCRATK
jgi:hypothetical protein